MRGLSLAQNEEQIASGMIVPYVKQFAYQSYFDSTLLEQALVAQKPASAGIVASTLSDEQEYGVGFSLASSSQTPVAVAPDGGAAIILRPGQTFFPGKQFRNFAWGLPFGWLGGGVAYLSVIRDPSAEFKQDISPEVIFHRARFKVYAGTDNPAIGTNYNWPNRFPWLSAGGISAITYQGLPASFGIEPTRVAMRLRLDSLAVSATMRLNFTKTEDFDQNNTNSSPPLATDYDAIGTSGSFVEVVWPIFSASAFQISGTVPKQYPMMMLNADTLRIGGDFGQLVLLAMDANIASGTFVDIVRYGRL